MRVPVSWLRELTPVEDDVDGLVASLHEIGLLVEDVHRPTPLDGVVVGEVRERHAVEGAKYVQYVLVDDGSGRGTDNGRWSSEWRGVMCGAFNFEVGDKVPVALPGSVLPNGMELGVRHVKSLGVTSHGMICSEDELGVGTDPDGIMVLDSDAPVGARVDEVLGLDDTVIELEVTPNRPDCMGMLGVAREVAARYRLPLRSVAPDLDGGSGVVAGDVATVLVDDPQGCPRYVAMVVDDVTVGASPSWLANRLRAAGMRPINNVVDVTNYVMLERGQPLHAFDLDRLAGPGIVVRRAADGEKMVTLDDVERTLTSSDLLICDADKPVAIAGVMGGANSEVAPTTTRLLLESAHFDAPMVLQTSKRLGLRSEASARFERGVDPGGCLDAAARGASLFAQFAGGEPAKEAIDVSDLDPEPHRIGLRPVRANGLIGTSLSGTEMTDLLAGIEVTRVDPAGDLAAGSDAKMTFVVPSWRPDLEREVDLVEEIVRLHGYNRVERTLPGGRERVGGLTAEQSAERRLRRALLAAGLFEAQTTTFVSRSQYDLLGWDDSLVEVRNPLRDEERYLRTSVVPGLLGAAAYNVARNNRSVRLFEIGRGIRASDRLLPGEQRLIAVVLSGLDLDDRVWTEGRGRPFDVFDLKGALESVASDLGLAVELVAASPGSDGVPRGLHPARAASVVLATGAGSSVTTAAAGSEPRAPELTSPVHVGPVHVDKNRVGWMGELHPGVAEAHDLPRSTVVAELQMEPIVAAHVAGQDDYSPVSAYPATFYDLAFVVREDVHAGDLAGTLRTSGGDLCRGVGLFDVFRGGQVPVGSKSLAFEIRFQADDRTLTDEDVRPVVERMVAAASSTHDADLRG